MHALVPIQTHLTNSLFQRIEKGLGNSKSKKILFLTLKLANLVFTSNIVSNLLGVKVKILIRPEEAITTDQSLISLLKGISFVDLKSYSEDDRSDDDILWIMSLSSEDIRSALSAIDVSNLMKNSKTKSLIVPVSCSATMDAWIVALESIPDAKEWVVHFVSLNLATRITNVTNVSLVEAAAACRKHIARGYFVGLETGACLSFAESMEDAVIMWNDSSLSYPSTLLNDEWLHEHNLIRPSHGISTPSKFVIDDLQLPGATTVFMTDTIQTALKVMQTHDFSQLPVVSENRRVVGLVSLQALQTLDLKAPVLEETVGRHMSRFVRGQGYRIVTVDTGLDVVEEMLEGTPAVFVTDQAGKFTLAVVTRSDLVKFYNSLHIQRQ